MQPIERPPEQSINALVPLKNPEQPCDEQQLITTVMKMALETQDVLALEHKKTFGEISLAIAAQKDGLTTASLEGQNLQGAIQKRQSESQQREQEFQTEKKVLENEIEALMAKIALENSKQAKLAQEQAMEIAGLQASKASLVEAQNQYAAQQVGEQNRDRQTYATNMQSQLSSIQGSQSSIRQQIAAQCSQLTAQLNETQIMVVRVREAQESNRAAFKEERKPLANKIMLLKLCLIDWLSKHPV